MFDICIALLILILGLAVFGLGIGAFVYDASIAALWWQHVLIALGGVAGLLFGTAAASSLVE